MARQENIETAEHLPLVAIDMGSASFKLVAAECVDPKSEFSQLRILSSDESSKKHCMRKGVIESPTEASYIIRESLLILANRIHYPVLPTAFTLLGGKSMRCTSVKVHRMLGKRPEVISQHLLDNMREECFVKIRKASNGKTETQPMEALDVRVEEFKLDNNVQTEEPQVGTTAADVEAKYSTFYGMPDLRKRVDGAYERAGKSIERAFARPVAHLEALASEEDELLGVAIVDMGAETTTISVFKAGKFLTCKVLPQGGKNITMDLQMQGISMADAEKLKVRFGSAYEDKTNVKAVRIRAAKEGDPDVIIKTDFLSEIIVARLEETLAPIFQELKQWEPHINKVYLTGGASKIRDIVPYFQQHTTLKVEYGSHADWLTEDTDPMYFAPEYSATIGALLLGAKHRRQHPNQPLPDTKIGNGRRTPNGFIDRFRDLFDGQQKLF